MSFLVRWVHSQLAGKQKKKMRSPFGLSVVVAVALAVGCCCCLVPTPAAAASFGRPTARPGPARLWQSMKQQLHLPPEMNAVLAILLLYFIIQNNVFL